jgi:hypothetical protein
MKSRKRITEEDLLVTEALISESFGRLKNSVSRAPSRALGSVSGTIHRHPFAAAAAALAGGLAAYVIIKQLTTSRVAVSSQKKERNRPDLMMEMLSMLLPLAAPHIAGYIQKYVGRILSAESS